MIRMMRRIRSADMWLLVERRERLKQEREQAAQREEKEDEDE